MRNGRRLIAFAMLWVFVLTIPAYGWFDQGHMTVAYVAYQQLSPKKKDRVDVLLRMNPDLENWLKLIPAGTSKKDERLMIFMIAATWPDRIKSDRTYKDDGTDGGNVPDGAPTNTLNIGYEDLFLHKYWHFVDLPFTQDGTPLMDVPVPNAQTQIAIFRKVLASNSPDALKSYDLAWLMHIVGDVHQPLHATARFGKNEPKGDAGGNFVKLCVAPCKNNLHSFWDGLPGESRAPIDAIKGGKLLPKPKPSLASNLKASTWVKESFKLAKTDVYVSPIGLGGGPFEITPAYRKNALAIAKQRVALAGVRLGKILNRELK
jgi:hypothetical protein